MGEKLAQTIERVFAATAEDAEISCLASGESERVAIDSQRSVSPRRASKARRTRGMDARSRRAMWQEQHRSVKRARDQAAAKAYLASREDSDYEFKRDHSRLLIVELCLKKQPYEWMSLSDIHAKTGLDPTEFLEQLKGDPNVELKDISEIGMDIFDVLNKPSSAPPTEKDIADLLYRAGKVNVGLLGPPDYHKFKERIGPSEEAKREFWAKVKAMTWGHKVDGSTYAVLIRYGASRSLKDY